MAKRARSEFKVGDLGITMTAQQLLVKGVPINHYGKKTGVKREGTLYHVNIQFASLEDVMMKACEKVLHDVGKAIAQNKPDNEVIKLTSDPAEYTTVDSSGMPPAAKKEKVVASMKAMVDTASDKKAMADTLLELLKSTGLSAADIAKALKK